LETSFLSLLLLARISAGQPAEKPATDTNSRSESGAELTRPVARGTFDVAYPEGETREALVVLELVIDRTGAVSDVRVVEGEPPFADAALTAAKQFDFEPARRGGTPVPARIRVGIRFVPPKLEPAPERAPDPGAPEPEPRAIGEQRVPRSTSPRIEIVVEGERPPPGRMTLGRAEVRELPGAFGDPFRAVEVFPGVTPIFTGVPFFYVRGSPPGNVGYFLDGVRVPLLFHVALGPSVIHPGLVDRVDIYPGGYPARYGRFGGAVVTAETTAPRRELRGEGNVRLFDAGALIEAPIAGGRGNVLVGGRYSYTAAMLSLFAPEVSLQYWDYQARGSFDLDSRWRLGALVFGAYDLFQSDADEASIGTQFHRLDLRAEHTPDPATRLRVAATIGLDRSAAEDPNSPDTSDSAILDDRLAGVRFELERRLSPGLLVRAGADVNLDDYRISEVELNDDDSAGTAPEVFYSRSDFMSGLRGDFVWEPERGVVITPGLRADLYWSGAHGAVAFEPRIAAEFAVGRRVTLAHTFGIAHQAPSFVVPIPGLVLSDLRDGLQRSLQSSAGVSVRPGSGFQIGLTVFHNVFLNLTDFLGTWTLRERAFSRDEDERLDIRSMGQAYGLELLVKRPFSNRFSGYLAYTLSRSTRSLGGDHTVANFDRTHVVHAALAYDLGRNWRSGARFSAYTGVPAQHDDSDFDENDPLSLLAVPAERRGPPFWRLDLRLEKRWLIDRRGRYWAFVVEMLNSTLNREVPFLTCGADGCTGDPIGPVTIPSIGAEVFF
jgi:TonB family protein